DLCTPPPTTAARTGTGSGELRFPPRSDGNGRSRAAARAASTPVLSSDESAVLRDRLLSEIASLQSQESAANWAQGALAAKNRLSAGDAKLVEEAFETKLSEFLPAEGAEFVNVDASESLSAIGKTDDPSAYQVGIDKSVLMVAAPRRYRNRDHLRFVMQQPCLLCGRKPSDPHHLGFTQPRALGRKVSDEFAVPLCRGHHRAVHRSRHERAWWRQAGIDPIKVARRLWKETHGIAQRRSQRLAKHRPHDAAAPTEPIQSNDDERAIAATQEESRLPDLPG